MLMTTQDDDFLKFNSYITPTAGVNPGGTEVGFMEETAEALVLNVAKPIESVDASGDALGLMTHGIRETALDRMWRRAVADGFDVSTPVDTFGGALHSLRKWVDDVDPHHPDYEVVAADWYKLQERTGSLGARSHWMYSMYIEGCVDSSGRSRLASVALSYVRGRALAAGRHAVAGTVMPILHAMEEESQRSCFPARFWSGRLHR